MKPVGFVICHGWSYTRHDLMPLAQCLMQVTPHVQVDDLGFGGDPYVARRDPDVAWIAVGHSYGFGHLLAQSNEWYGAVSIAGFTRFEAVAQAERLQRILERRPVAALTAFRNLIDDGSRDLPMVNDASLARLTTALEILRTRELSLPSLPILALAGLHDRLVTTASTEAMFADQPKTSVRYHSDCGHALGIVHEQWCTDAVATWIPALDLAATNAGGYLNG